MRISCKNKNLSFTVNAPVSKSIAHRELIVRFLSLERTHLADDAADNDDIRATKACLRALESVEKASGTGTVPSEVTLPCNESGSTLRFMIPVASAFLFGRKQYPGLERICFETKGRLFDRPVKELQDAMLPHGITITKDDQTRRIIVSGRMTSGEYVIDGSVSSQYISGLLMALPLLEMPSRIRITGECKSIHYIGLTVDVLAKYDNPTEFKNNTFFVPAPGYKTLPGEDFNVEGDWSNGAFLLCLQKFTDITVNGLNYESKQGDIAILDFLKLTEGIDYTNGPADKSVTVNCTDTPDIAPYMAVTAPFFFAKSEFTGIGRLRIKESDRVRAVREQLSAFGIRTEESGDVLTVYGSDLYPGRINTPPENVLLSSFHDHRMAMCAVLLAVIFRTTVDIDDTECLKKSFPEFLDILEKYFK